MKIAAIIVTFNCENKILKCVKSICNSVDKIFIIDNASKTPTIRTLKKIQKIYYCIEIIYNKTNIGLGKAQNIGIKLAIEQGFSWVLLMDHDSYFNKKGIDYLKQYYISLPKNRKSKIAIIAPKVFDINLNTYYSNLKKWKKLFFKRIKCKSKTSIKDVLFCISSGSLIKLDAIKKIGLLKEDFFIDFIDVEFCLRAISNQYCIDIVCNSILFHELGKRKSFNIGNLKIKPTFHSPIRKFFLYRNRVIVWKKYIFLVPNFVFYDILASIYDILRIILFEPNKFSKIYMAIKGFLRGLTTN